MSCATAAFAAHCAVLGLRSVRTIDELNAAYRPLIRQWHPDRHHAQATHAIAVDRATAINAAYAFLLAALEKESAAPRTSRPPSGHGFPDVSVVEIFVKPSAVISVGYNRASADLFVKYVGHRIYRYRGVPPAVVEALILAPSASTFVREQLDRHFESEALKRTT